jgi:cellulose synthase/poly-beta-1,6-N-acetylglucosamine synthase-like glycosyltransferase
MVIPKNIAVIRLIGITPQPAAVKLVSESNANRFNLLPLYVENDQLVAASAFANDPNHIQKASAAIRWPIRPVQAVFSEVQTAIHELYSPLPSWVQTLELGKALIYLGYLSEDGLETARQQSALDGKSLEAVLLEYNLVQEEQLVEAAALISHLPHLRAASLQFRPDLAPLVPWKLAHNRRILPLWWASDRLAVGICNVAHTDYQHDLDQIQLPADAVLCPQTAWEKIFQRTYLKGPEVIEIADPEKVALQLVESGKITEAEYASSRALAQQMGKSLEDILLERDIVSREIWFKARADLLGLEPGSTIQSTTQTKSASELLSPALQRRFGILAVKSEKGHLYVEMANPEHKIVQMLESITGQSVRVKLADPQKLQQALPKAVDDRLSYCPSLAEILLANHMVQKEQIEEALGRQNYDDRRLATRLLSLGYLNDLDLCEARSLQTGIPYISLDQVAPDQAALDRLPSALVLKHQVLPLFILGGDLWVAVNDPLDAIGQQAIENASGLNIRIVLAPLSSLQAAVDRMFTETYAGASQEQRRLVTALVSYGALTQVEALEVLRLYTQEGFAFDDAIIKASHKNERELVTIYAEMTGLPIFNAELHQKLVETVSPIGDTVQRPMGFDPVDRSVASLLDIDTCKRLCALPVKVVEGRVWVAFSSPLIETPRLEIEKLLGTHIQPCLTPRSNLLDATERNLGIQNLGTALLLSGLVTRHQLNDALEYARRTGVRLGRAMVSRGYIKRSHLSRFLAAQADIPFFDLHKADLDPNIAQLLDPETAREYGMLPISSDEEQVTLAITDPLDKVALKEAAKQIGKNIRPVLVAEDDLEDALERLYHQRYISQSVSELLERVPDDSAYRIITGRQQIALIVFLVLSAIWIWFDRLSYAIALNLFFTIMYLGVSVYRLFLISQSMDHDLVIPVTEEEIAALNDQDLPVYTVLMPVYKEAKVLPVLIQAIDHMDYPKTKLDIKVLLEADDTDTIDAFRALNPPAYFHPVIVPVALPRTKPKACNYGLIHAQGELVVIFDAEDLPEPDQLKRIYIAFQKADPEVVCIQAKLNFYNRHENLLTQWFTAEYSMWFDLFLPGLDASRVPIPLGGTSNHFKREALVDVNAWDPYNVTEDADLGVRLFKRGYRTAIIDSTTYEEANSVLNNWIRQRSRWIKGYIITWLVHMRHPVKLFRELGFKPFLSMQLVMAGTFMTALLNPIFWCLTTLWFLAKWGVIESIFPGPIYYLGMFCLFVGNFAFTYVNVIGAIRRGYHDAVKYALLSPLYWGLISIAAYKGFWQLITRPHFWEKTHHGLSKSPQNTQAAPPTNQVA